MPDKSLDVLVRILTEQVGEQKANEILAQVTAESGKAAGATDALSESTKKATGSFSESRREIRMVGNELGRAAGISNAGGLALGGVAAAAFFAAKAVGFLASTWNEIQKAIEGPLKLEVTDAASENIGKVANAWDQYATARAKADEHSPETAESAAEKRFTHELDLIKQVMEAEKKKALAELEAKKDSMTPGAYAAGKMEIENAWSTASAAQKEKTEDAILAAKQNEAYQLSLKAVKDKAAAEAIVVPQDSDHGGIGFVLKKNAEDAKNAIPEITEQLAMIERLHKSATGQFVLEYEGVGGAAKNIQDYQKFVRDYGYRGDLGYAKENEGRNLSQAQAAISTDNLFTADVDTKTKKKEELGTKAGEEQGSADKLYEAIGNLIAEQVQTSIANAITRGLGDASASAGKLSPAEAVAQLRENYAAVAALQQMLTEAIENHSSFMVPQIQEAIAALQQADANMASQSANSRFGGG